MKKIDEIQKTFGIYLSERSYVFQKFSFHGLILAREILSKAREEVNKQCLEDLATEINEKQKKIKEIAKVDDQNKIKNYKGSEARPGQPTDEQQKPEEEQQTEAVETPAIEEIKEAEVDEEVKQIVVEPTRERSDDDQNQK